MHLPIFRPVHGTPSTVGTPLGEVSPLAAAASSTVDLACRPSGLATEAPGLVAVAKAPSQFRLNSTVSVTCAKWYPRHGAAKRGDSRVRAQPLASFIQPLRHRNSSLRESRCDHHAAVGRDRYR